MYSLSNGIRFRDLVVRWTVLLPLKMIRCRVWRERGHGAMPTALLREMLKIYA